MASQYLSRNLIATLTPSSATTDLLVERWLPRAESAQIYEKPGLFPVMSGCLNISMNTVYLGLAAITFVGGLGAGQWGVGLPIGDPGIWGTERTKKEPLDPFCLQFLLLSFQQSGPWIDLQNSTVMRHGGWKFKQGTWLTLRPWKGLPWQHNAKVSQATWSQLWIKRRSTVDAFLLALCNPWCETVKWNVSCIHLYTIYWSAHPTTRRKEQEQLERFSDASFM